MTDTAVEAAGTLTLADDLVLTRMGYGAMQLAGKGVFGPPKDPDEAARVLRAVVEMGITHVDTSDFYGPHVTNRLIRDTLHPYADDLRIVTKVGARRDEKGAWLPALAPDELRSAVDDNLTNLGVEALDVVNLRLHGDRKGRPDASEQVADKLGVLAGLVEEGKIRHLGISNVTLEGYRAARETTEIVCVQNEYNLANRQDDPLVDACAEDGVAFVPFFPIGGFSPLQSDVLDRCAQQVGATPLQTALAWLLQRSPTMLLIPGTSSVAHLRENVAAAQLSLPDDVLAELEGIGG